MMIFDMGDTDKNGVIDKLELSEMLRSLVEIARTDKSLPDNQVSYQLEIRKKVIRKEEEKR